MIKILLNIIQVLQQKWNILYYTRYGINCNWNEKWMSGKRGTGSKDWKTAQNHGRIGLYI